MAKIEKISKAISNTMEIANNTANWIKARYKQAENNPNIRIHPSYIIREDYNFIIDLIRIEIAEIYNENHFDTVDDFFEAIGEYFDTGTYKIEEPKM